MAYNYGIYVHYNKRHKFIGDLKQKGTLAKYLVPNLLIRRKIALLLVAQIRIPQEYFP